MGVRAVRWLANGGHTALDLLITDQLLIYLRVARNAWHHLSASAAARAKAVDRRRIGRAASAIAAVVAVLGVASADGVAVMDRPRPDYDAKGIPLGAFRLFPSVDVQAGVTDNVFETDTNTKSDFRLDIAPAVKLASEWSQHMVQFFARLRTLQYADYSSENLTDWAFGAEGRLDVRRSSFITAGIFDSVGHEGRSSPNAPGNIKEPIEYSLVHANGGVTIKPNNLEIFLGAELDSYAYEVSALNGGGFLDNGDRDRDELRLRARFSFELSEGYRAFFEGIYDRRMFDRDIDRTGVNRDSNGRSVNAGFEFKLVEFLQGEVFVGYLDRQFGAPLRDFSGFNYGSALKWSATPLTTVHLTASRTLNDTTVPGASLIADNALGLGIDHELRRNLIVQANVTYVDSDFVGTARNDDSVEARVGATYLIDRNLSATAEYERRERDSSSFGEDFSEDKFNVGLRVQL